GTMSVIIFGYIGGILVDRRGPLYVLNIGVTFLSVSFLTASFLLETTSWFMTIIIVFVLGGLSFTKTVISTIVSSSLKQQEAGRSEEHTSELQSRFDLVCRLLL